MEHSYINDNQIIEKYLLHQLSDDDAAAFEEHLLICQECRSELEKMETILVHVGRSKVQEIFSDESSRKQRPFRLKPGFSAFYRMAASLLIFIGISVILIYFLKRERKPEYQIVNEPVTQADTIRQSPTDSLAIHNHTGSHSGYLASDDKAFKPSSFYEPLVSNIYRSAQLKIIEPVVNYKTGEIIFNWSYMKSDSLVILLINNKDSVIFKQKVTPPYKYTARPKPGLYYWQLQSDEELLYTGKLIIHTAK